MTDLSPARAVRLPGMGVPVDLLEAPDRFGGRIVGDLRVGTLVIADGRVQRLEASEAPARRIVLPALTEAHVHLDKCHTVDRCHGVGGDLQAAIAAQGRDKAAWTPGDIAARARRGLAELQRAGCRAVRSHVDWPGGAEAANAPMAWDVLRCLRDEAAQDGTDLQLAALTGIDDMADAGAAEAVARRMAREGGVWGAFVLGQPDRRAGLRRMFALADRFGLALDFHVDESLNGALDGVEMIADTALETGFAGPVLCGHACALASQAPDDIARVADKLARAGIHVAALPGTNLYLQGRSAGGTPDRRGLTRLHELAAAGVPTVLGTDNVRDAFMPLGAHDPLHTLSLAVASAHLDPPFGRHLPMITTRARAALGLAPVHLETADLATLMLIDAASLSEIFTPGVPRAPLTHALKGEPLAR